MARERRNRLAYPSAHWFTRLSRQNRKSYSPRFPGFVRPYQLALDLDLMIMLPEPETNRIPLIVSWNGSNGVKTKSAFGNIQHAAAITGFNVDIGESFHVLAWSLPAFRPLHRHHHGVERILMNHFRNN